VPKEGGREGGWRVGEKRYGSRSGGRREGLRTLIFDGEDFLHVDIEVSHGITRSDLLLVEDSEGEADAINVLHHVLLERREGREGGRKGGRE